MTQKDKKQTESAANNQGKGCAVNSKFNFTVGILAILVFILLAVFFYHHHIAK